MLCDSFSVKVFFTLAILLNRQLVTCQQSRIVGGFNVTSIVGYKHQVSLRLASADKTFGQGHLCGGSLISYRTVLTAAHCIHDGNQYLKAFNYVVSMGGLDRWVRDNNTLYITVMRAYGHENFKPKTFENDVAVLFLTQSVPENHPTAQPIVLSTQNAVAGQTCQISGWGTTAYFKGIQPNRLMAVNLVVNSKADCNQRNRHNGNVLNGMFCAGPFIGPNIVDSCQGDSGGPLTCNGVLVGITSNGVECAVPNYPGIYIDVHHYRSWIQKNHSSTLMTNFVTILRAFVLSICIGKII